MNTDSIDSTQLETSNIQQLFQRYVNVEDDIKDVGVLENKLKEMLQSELLEMSDRFAVVCILYILDIINNDAAVKEVNEFLIIWNKKLPLIQRVEEMISLIKARREKCGDRINTLVNIYNKNILPALNSKYPGIDPQFGELSTSSFVITVSKQYTAAIIPLGLINNLPNPVIAISFDYLKYDRIPDILQVIIHESIHARVLSNTKDIKEYEDQSLVSLLEFSTVQLTKDLRGHLSVASELEILKDQRFATSIDDGYSSLYYYFLAFFQYLEISMETISRFGLHQRPSEVLNYLKSVYSELSIENKQKLINFLYEQLLISPTDSKLFMANIPLDFENIYQAIFRYYNLHLTKSGPFQFTFRRSTLVNFYAAVDEESSSTGMYKDVLTRSLGDYSKFFNRDQSGSINIKDIEGLANSLELFLTKDSS